MNTTFIQTVFQAAPAAAQKAAAVATAVASAASQNIKLTPEMMKALQAQAAAQMNPSRSPLAQKLPWLTHGFAGIFVISAVLLVLLLAMQTTKQEGLTGTIGGRMESAYRGRLGTDQQIARWTTYVAVSFVFFGILLSLSGI